MTNHLQLPSSALAALPGWSAPVRDLIIEQLADARGVHLETAITGIASVAGCLLLRSSGVRLDGLSPGQPVFVESVDALGPACVRFLSATCADFGIEPDGGWADPVPPKHQPLRDPFALTELLEPIYVSLCERLAVPATARVALALFTAVRLCWQGRQILALNTGKALILNALVAGSKTVPPSVNDLVQSVQQ